MMLRNSLMPYMRKISATVDTSGNNASLISSVSIRCTFTLLMAIALMPVEASNRA
ncbi:hypothetical protein D3C81_1260530 [compost metagenome]